MQLVSDARCLSGLVVALSEPAVAFSGLADCARGASLSTCATLRALIGVDAIDVALGDSAHGAFVDTCAASDAVFTNYVSHNDTIKCLRKCDYCLVLRRKDTYFR